MSHLDTAYKLGALHAQQAFEAHIQKQAQTPEMPSYMSLATPPPKPKSKVVPSGSLMPKKQVAAPPKATAMRQHVPAAPPMGKGI